MRSIALSASRRVQTSFLALCVILIACSAPAALVHSQGTAPSAKTWQGDVVEVQLTSLKGPIVLNRAYVGDIETVKIMNGRGVSEDATPGNVITDKADKALTLLLPDDQRASRVIITGSEGRIILALASSSVTTPPNVLWPIDGMIDIRSGTLNETIQVAEGAVDMDKPAAAHRVTVGGSETDIIAMRNNEIAVAGDGIDLAPQGTSVLVLSPGGGRSEGEVPAWGYKVYMQPVTDLNAWAPIFAQVTGLFPDEIVTMSFASEGDQRIEPSTITITGNQAQDGMTVAYFLTRSEGDQTFNVEVQRNSAQPAGR